MNKKILILLACGHLDEKKECISIKAQCELYSIDVYQHQPKSTKNLDNILDKYFKQRIEFDYIYLSAHGSEFGFGNELETINYDWMDFGIKLCETQCMKEDAVLMLSCCRGGLNQVAYDLFYCCPNIAYIVGPRQSLTSDYMIMAFSILLFNIEHRNTDPIVACEKIKLGTDIRFLCFDRLETEGEASYLMRINSYTNDLKGEIEETKEKIQHNSSC